MSALYLACCVRGMEVTRHFTPELGATIAAMLGFALLVAVFILLVSPAILPKKA